MRLQAHVGFCQHPRRASGDIEEATRLTIRNVSIAAEKEDIMKLLEKQEAPVKKVVLLKEWTGETETCTAFVELKEKGKVQQVVKDINETEYCGKEILLDSLSDIDLSDPPFFKELNMHDYSYDLQISLNASNSLETFFIVKSSTPEIELQNTFPHQSENVKSEEDGYENTLSDSEERKLRKRTRDFDKAENNYRRDSLDKASKLLKVSHDETSKPRSDDKAASQNRNALCSETASISRRVSGNKTESKDRRNSDGTAASKKRKDSDEKIADKSRTYSDGYSGRQSPRVSDFKAASKSLRNPDDKAASKSRETSDSNVASKFRRDSDGKTVSKSRGSSGIPATKSRCDSEVEASKSLRDPDYKVASRSLRISDYKVASRSLSDSDYKVASKSLGKTDGKTQSKNRTDSDHKTENKSRYSGDKPATKSRYDSEMTSRKSLRDSDHNLANKSLRNSTSSKHRTDSDRKASIKSRRDPNDRTSCNSRRNWDARATVPSQRSSGGEVASMNRRNFSSNKDRRFVCLRSVGSGPNAGIIMTQETFKGMKTVYEASSTDRFDRNHFTGRTNVCSSNYYGQSNYYGTSRGYSDW